MTDEQTRGLAHVAGEVANAIGRTDSGATTIEKLDGHLAKIISALVNDATMPLLMPDDPSDAETQTEIAKCARDAAKLYEVVAYWQSGGKLESVIDMIATIADCLVADDLERTEVDAS